MKYQPEIYLTEEECKALCKDPLYRSKIEVGLECGVVEIKKNDSHEPVISPRGVPA